MFRYLKLFVSLCFILTLLIVGGVYIYAGSPTPTWGGPLSSGEGPGGVWPIYTQLFNALITGNTNPAAMVPVQNFLELPDLAVLKSRRIFCDGTYKEVKDCSGLGGGGGGGTGTINKTYSGIATVSFNTGSPHSNMATITFPGSCTNPKIVTQSLTDSIPAFCPSSASMDIHSYIANISTTGFGTYLSGDCNANWGSLASAPSQSIAWLAVCDEQIAAGGGGDTDWVEVTPGGTGNIYRTAGTVGIGTATPNASYKLDVAGNTKISGVLETAALRVTGGAVAAGKVLTADASGNATWQTSTAGIPKIKVYHFSKPSSTTFSPDSMAGENWRVRSLGTHFYCTLLHTDEQDGEWCGTYPKNFEIPEDNNMESSQYTAPQEWMYGAVGGGTRCGVVCIDY